MYSILKRSVLGLLLLAIVTGSFFRMISTTNTQPIDEPCDLRTDSDVCPTPTPTLMPTPTLTPTPRPSPSPTPTPTPPPTPMPTPICRICSSVPGSEADFHDLATNRGKCCDCFENQGGAWTAIGCILPSPSKPRGFVPVLLSFGIGISGGIAFLMILYGGILILTSSGDPERTATGREIIGGALKGLLLLLFSLFLLRIFGVNLLGIPGIG